MAFWHTIFFNIITGTRRGIAYMRQKKFTQVVKHKNIFFLNSKYFFLKHQ